MEEHSYYWSYDKLHKELRRHLSLEYDAYKDVTVLEYLCKHYLSKELIGNEHYADVEWNRMGLDNESPHTVVQSLNNRLESLRVLVFWRDHVHEVMPALSAEQDIDRFMDACCKEINAIMSYYASHADPDSKEYQYAQEIARGETYFDYDIDDQIRSILQRLLEPHGEDTELIFRYMPHASHLHFDIFSEKSIWRATNDIYYHFKEDLSKSENKELVLNKWSNIPSWIPKIREHISDSENRFVQEDDHTPIEQVLFALVVKLYITVDCNKEDGDYGLEEVPADLYETFADRIVDYAKEQFLDFESHLNDSMQDDEAPSKFLFILSDDPEQIKIINMRITLSLDSPSRLRDVLKQLEKEHKLALPEKAIDIITEVKKSWPQCTINDHSFATVWSRR